MKVKLLKLKIVNFIHFFIFLFLFYFLDLEIEISMTSYVTITKYHMM